MEMEKKISAALFIIIISSIIIFESCHAAAYISEDEVYRMIDEQYHEQMIEKQRAEDEGRYILNVESKNDFLEALCYQIKDYREEVYYDTNSADIYYNIDDVIDEFWTYYCSNNPIVSGCYMKGYLDGGINYTYDKKYDTDECRYRIEIRLKYKYPREKFDEHIKHMTELANTLKCDNDYDSVKAVHDYLIEKFDYDYDYKNHDELQGMDEGVMVCSGYAMAAFNLLSNMNIPVRIIEGRTVGKNDEVDGHAWNIVCVDGQWYNMDVTWDDMGEDGTNYLFFLKGSNEFSGHFPYEEYIKTESLVTDSSYDLSTEIEDNVQESNVALQTEVNDSWDVVIMKMLGICGLLIVAVVVRFIRK